MRETSFRRRKITIIFCMAPVFWIGVLFCSTFPVLAGPSTAVQNVYLLVIDGVRPDVLQEAYTPHLDGLKREGAYTGKAWTVFPSTTLAAIPSLQTGTPPEVHQVTDWNGSVRAHTLTEVFKEKGKTVVLVRQSGITGNYQADYATGLWYPSSVDNPDRYFVERALELIDEYNPFYLTWYSSTPDNRGHRYGHDSEEYQQAIEHVDGEVGIFLKGLRERNLLENALIVVTTDHGMTGKMHSLGYETDMRIFSIWRGPYIKDNYQIPEKKHIPGREAAKVMIDVKSVSQSEWCAETISWNNQPATGKKVASSYVDELGWHGWDLTDYVKEQSFDNSLSVAMMAREPEGEVIYESVFFNTTRWWTNPVSLEIEYSYDDESATMTVKPEREAFIKEEEPDAVFNEGEYFFIGRNYYLKGRAYLHFCLEEISGSQSIEKATLRAWCWRQWPPEGHQETVVSHEIIDIAPTIAFLTGMPPLRDSQGRVIKEIIKAPE